MKKFLYFKINLAFLIFICIGCFSCAKPVLIGKINTENEIFATSKFINASQDIPLINGLEIINDQNLEFDSLSGSFSSSTYQSKFEIAKIKNFYELNLPKLGWKIYKSIDNSSVFTRDNEKLEIEFSQQDGYNLVVFCHRSTI